MICRLCLNNLDEQNVVLLFGAAENDKNKTLPEDYLVQLISTHLYLCLSRDDAISTCICTDCRAQLESFHKFWKLVELKQTTLCSQFLEIDCDVNWSEEGDAEMTANDEADPDTEPNETPPVGFGYFIKEEPEVHEVFKNDAKTTSHKFPCMYCEKSFKMRRYLEEHVATHTGDRPIACSYCDMSFRCRSNMYTHVKTKHNEQWRKARADRESAKLNTNNNIQTPANGDKPCVFIERDAAAKSVVAPETAAITPSPSQPVPVWQNALAPAELLVKKELSPATGTSSNLPPSVKLSTLSTQNSFLNVKLPTLPTSAATQNVKLPTLSTQNMKPTLPVLAPESQSSAQRQPAKAIKIESEPMEAINLTVAKPTTACSKRNTRSNRRKTHSPKKVQHNELSANEDSNAEDAEMHEKRIKIELQTSKENELMLANYNAVAAAASAVAATLNSNPTDTLQLRLRASIIQQQQDLLTAMVAANTANSGGASTAMAAAATLAAQSSTPALDAEVGSSAYTCGICGQHLRNQRALNNHLHNKHPTQQPTPNLEVAACANCGELPGQKHRCLSKAKHACDVCGKSFKMKRYLEEHFATHTGVKLHTCAFCPTEFRSKSNMYHHTKRKHKLEWERLRASRNAAKSGAHEQQLEESGATAAVTTTTSGEQVNTGGSVA
ncbi:zinc finger protein 236 [Scaptodrosophila lebanonensis]|uniref:Zinc finger protein 236 n=1 Tax=Drosophila lebanonensis TaxID=7225 RepID=A0A6J2TT70_DROLE|nr:zinc finger protein 236 [Scaptodrosophila lebanonensis]